MRKFILTSLLVWVAVVAIQAQTGAVENRPYADLRKLHFGVLIGTHVQDLEFRNVGPQTLALEDGTLYESLVTVDQDRWDAGLTVGVLAELRLHELFQLRVAPAMYFGTRHLTYHNFTPWESESNKEEETQNLKAAYFSTAFDLIFAAPRNGNVRPYLMMGLNPMLNLTGRDNDYIKLKRYDAFLEAGIGCDLYLQFFKLRPELKFMYGLTNSFDASHADNLRDLTMLRFTKAADKSRSKMIALTFYFE